MILEACIDWDDPELPIIGLDGEPLETRHANAPANGVELVPSPAADRFVSHLDDTGSILRTFERGDVDYRVTLHRVKGDYLRAIRIVTHCMERVWFFRKTTEANAAWRFLMKLER